MLKMQIIGHLGKDAIINNHGTDTVVNFSVAHTDKYKDGNGNTVNKTVWINCSWWIDSRSAVIQYLKKGLQIYAEGIPAAKMWAKNDGQKECGLTIRILNLQLLGGAKTEQSAEGPAQQAPANDGYKPLQNQVDDFDGLPF